MLRKISKVRRFVRPDQDVSVIRNAINFVAPFGCIFAAALLIGGVLALTSRLGPGASDVRVPPLSMSEDRQITPQELSPLPPVKVPTDDEPSSERDLILAEPPLASNGVLLIATGFSPAQDPASPTDGQVVDEPITAPTADPALPTPQPTGPAAPDPDPEVTRPTVSPTAPEVVPTTPTEGTPSQDPEPTIKETNPSTEETQPSSVPEVTSAPEPEVTSEPVPVPEVVLADPLPGIYETIATVLEDATDS
jgi:hypothetical protein